MTITSAVGPWMAGAAESRPACVGDAAVRRRLAEATARVPRVAWLRLGRFDAAPDPAAEVLLSPGQGIRVLIDTAQAADRTARHLAAGWPGTAADIRVSGGAPDRRGPRCDLVLAGRGGVLAVGTRADGVPVLHTVDDPLVVAVLAGVWSSLWAGALPLAPAADVAEAAREDVKVAILRLLETGAKDEVVARALGISLRTCRRHIAELLAATGSASRFQAAARLTRAGWCGSGS
jgi:DNA-binding CsgD family transcriptional regulator